MRRLKGASLMFLLCCCGASLAAERWYSQAERDRGARLFQQNCAVCHGANAEGTADWKQRDANGNLPPPPLNGTAHAWHHSIPQLARSIKEGSIRLGGTMPPFGDKFSNRDVLALIAYFQSKWPDDLYARWHQRFMQ